MCLMSCLPLLVMRERSCGKASFLEGGILSIKHSSAVCSFLLCEEQQLYLCLLGLDDWLSSDTCRHLKSNRNYTFTVVVLKVKTA